MKAILTGHSRGLGAAIGAELLARGLPVLGLARRLNQDLAARHPQLLQHELDLGDAAALGDWLAGDALSGFLADARAVLLINNAGIVQPVGPAAVQDPATVAQAVVLNVAAPLMLTAAVARLPVPEKRVLHVSSGAARQAYPGWSVYCATKAALDHHARATVLDAAAGLRICSLAPGVIDTDMQAEIRDVASDRFPIRERFVALKREGQLTSPEDCARRLVDFLLAPGFGEQPVADLRD